MNRNGWDWIGRTAKERKSTQGKGVKRQAMLTSTIIKKDDRAAVIDLFQKLAKEQGLTPQKLVDIARDDKHVLHGYFEWHDGVAAEKYRQTQARQLIQSVKVRIVTAPEQVTHLRAIMSVPANGKEVRPRYAMTSEIASDKDATERIKEQAIVELARLRKKYDALILLPKFAKIFTAVDELEA
jgi:hypothetical protein